MKRGWAFLALLSTSAPLLGADTVALKYDDLPRLVAERNQNVQGARGLVEASRTRTGHFRRSFGPSVRLEAGQEAFKTGSYDSASQPYGAAEAQINLYRGGRDRLEEDARRAEVDASSASARQVYVEELAEARRLYTALVFDQEMIRTLTGAAERNEKILASANRRVNRGLATETDRLEFEMLGLKLEEEIESLRRDILLVETALAPLVGMAAGTVFQTEDTLPHSHDDALLAAAFSPEAAPGFMALRANQALLERQGRSAGAAWRPSLDVYGGYHLYTRRERDFPERTDRDDTVGGVRLSVGLWDGLQMRRQADALAQQSRAYGLQASHEKEALSAREMVLKEGLKHHHELLHSSEKQIELSQKYLSRTLEEYDRGVKNSPDVLSAFQKSLDLQRQYAERRRDYQTVRADLLRLVEQ